MHTTQKAETQDITATTAAHTERLFNSQDVHLILETLNSSDLADIGAYHMLYHMLFLRCQRHMITTDVC